MGKSVKKYDFHKLARDISESKVKPEQIYVKYNDIKPYTGLWGIYDYWENLN